MFHATLRRESVSLGVSIPSLSPSPSPSPWPAPFPFAWPCQGPFPSELLHLHWWAPRYCLRWQRKEGRIGNRGKTGSRRQAFALGGSLMCVVNLIYAAKQSNYCIVCPSLALLSLCFSALLFLFFPLLLLLLLLGYVCYCCCRVFYLSLSVALISLYCRLGLASVPSCFIMN